MEREESKLEIEQKEDNDLTQEKIKAQNLVRYERPHYARFPKNGGRRPLPPVRRNLSESDTKTEKKKRVCYFCIFC